MTAAPASHPAGPPKIRPSFVWIVVSILLLIVGPGGCTAVLVSQAVGVLDDFDEFGRVELPTEGTTVHFDGPVADAALFVRGSTGDATARLDTVTMTDPSGEPVALLVPSETVTSDYPDGGQLRLVYRFTVPEAGDYVIAASVFPGGEGLELFVGRYDLERLGKWVAGAAAIGGLMFVVGLVLLIVVLVRRSRAKRARLAPPSWGPPPPGWGPPGSQPPPPGWGPPGTQPPPPPSPPGGWGAPGHTPPSPVEPPSTGWAPPSSSPPPPPGWNPAPPSDPSAPYPPAPPGDQP